MGLGLKNHPDMNHDMLHCVNCFPGPGAAEEGFESRIQDPAKAEAMAYAEAPHRELAKAAENSPQDPERIAQVRDMALEKADLAAEQAAQEYDAQNPKPDPPGPESGYSGEGTQIGAEVLGNEPEYEIIAVRHGAYQGEDGPEENIGWLTSDGVEQARETADHILQEAEKLGLPTDILIVNSPTAYEDKTGQQYGRRAEQTAVIMMDRIQEAAKDTPQDRLRLIGGGVGPQHHQALAEPNIHYIAGTDNPRAYIKAMMEKYGKADRWEGYHRGNEEVDEIGRAIGAETSADVGEREIQLIRQLNELAGVHKQEAPDRSLIIVLVTHNDSMRALLQHELGAGEEAYDYSPGYGEFLDMRVEDGELKVKLKDKTFSKRL